MSPRDGLIDRHVPSVQYLFGFELQVFLIGSGLAVGSWASKFAAKMEEILKPCKSSDRGSVFFGESPRNQHRIIKIALLALINSTP